MKNNKGFTLIELILVIGLLGILAVAALPKIFDITETKARDNARSAVASAVQTGISLYAAKEVASGNALDYPAALDTIDTSTSAVTCSTTKECFSDVLQQGITSGDWEKTTEDTYTYNGTKIYTYIESLGTFKCTSGC
jgi:prepilin-type N-terminal cleavage/methylation domain-containing protein